MNRNEVILTIKKAGERFENVMSAFCGEEFAAGYDRAIVDMIRLFNKAPIAADHEAEREAMLAHIKMLEEENERLRQDVCEKHAAIQKLMNHVNISEVLGVNVDRKPKTGRRVAVFTFR